MINFQLILYKNIRQSSFWVITIHEVSEQVINVFSNVYASIFQTGLIKQMKKGMVLFLLCLCTCSVKPQQYSCTVGVMGAVCRITCYTDKPAKEADAILQECTAHLHILDSFFDFHNPQSFLNTVNKNAGDVPVEVPEHVQPLFERAVFFAQHTNGAFNPILGAVTRLWNIGFDNAAVPAYDDIQKALCLTDYRMIEYEKGRIFLPKQGMQCDLGAIVKGFAADEVANILKKHRIVRAVIDIGGTLTLIGNSQKQPYWTIGIRDPVSTDNQPAALIKTAACSVATSGSYERFFEKDGIYYHHIIDSTTGNPVTNGLCSVTILTPSAADADALSTACFVLGYEASIPLLAAIPDTKAVFIFNDGTIKITAGVEPCIQIVNSHYSLYSKGDQ